MCAWHRSGLRVDQPNYVGGPDTADDAQLAKGCEVRLIGHAKSRVGPTETSKCVGPTYSVFDFEGDPDYPDNGGLPLEPAGVPGYCGCMWCSCPSTTACEWAPARAESHRSFAGVACLTACWISAGAGEGAVCLLTGACECMCVCARVRARGHARVHVPGPSKV